MRKSRLDKKRREADLLRKRRSQARTHRIDLAPLPRRHGKTPMLYQGKAIGASNSPLYAASLWLLDNGLAWPDDVVSTYRGETLCMSGKAGELAKWTVEETKHGNPSLVLRHWKAFETLGERSPAAETAEAPDGPPA